MAKDPSLKFVNRSGPQVRDRFRLKYPNHYDQGGSAVAERFSTGNEAIDRRASCFAPLQMRPWREDSEDREYEDTDNEPNDSEAQSQKPAPATSKYFTAPPLMATAPYGIMGLLNDDEEANRLSASLRYEWDENLTLPPLVQWEDIATKPMFDL